MATWVLVTGAASIIGIFGLPDEISTLIRILGILTLSFLCAAILFLYQAYEIYKKARKPASIRTVVGGKHHYRGTIVLILDKSTWVEPGQILVLVQSTDGFQTPLALIRVETFTTEKYPQCVLLSPLTEENLENYLMDSSRWKSMAALPEIKYSYFEGAQNAQR